MGKEQSIITIVLADDHEIFRDGFHSLIKKFPEISLVGEAGNGRDLIQLVEQLNPDVVLTDIKMPEMDGIEATRLMASKRNSPKIIALSMFNEDSLIIDMLEAGAKGYLLKNAGKQEIIEAIKAVNEDKAYYCKDTSQKLVELISKSKFNPHKKQAKPEFTDRELDIIRLICEQASSREIANQLNLSIRTIEGYRERILEKMEVHNTAGIVIYAIKSSIYQLK